WYAETYSLVAFIADAYGEDKLGEVILTLADNHPMEETLQLTLDMDLIEFEMAWREWLGYPVDSIPTPVMLAPLPIVTIPLPTSPRGQPAATATPEPAISTTISPTPTPSPADVFPSLPCCISFIVVLLMTFASMLARPWLP
ncbi:MAG: hypothetical protein U9R15_05005, partial [Chloroflexota bacterium]|nr:hypothetical protein [Chloroflexota bacterium]